MSPAKRYVVAPQGGGPPLLIATNSPLVSGEVGLAYSQTLQGTGGAPPYFWSVVSGFFPTGLNLSTGGVVSGTPSATGSSTVVLRIMDSRGTLSPTKSFGITVVAAVTITTGATLPTATQGLTYTQTLAATGGVTPYTWSLLSQTGSNTWSVSSSGTISGTPTSSETDSLDIQVVDALGGISTRVFSLTVQNSLYITTTSPLSTATQGSAYSFTMAAVGGTAPYTWSLTSQTGSNSWSLSSGGVITGTPANVETDSLVIKVTDSASATFSGTFTITTAAKMNYLGMNLAQPGYGATQQAFLNLVKGANANGTSYMPHAWGTFSSVGGTSSTGEEPFVQIDANGYPTSLTAGNNFSGMQVFTCLGIWMNYNTFDGSSLPSTVPGYYPSGSYTIQFQGSGTLVLKGDAANGSVAYASGGASNVTVNTSTNTITSTLSGAAQGSVTFSVPTPTNSGIQFYLTATGAAPNNLQALACVQTSLLASYNAGQYFHPNFLASIVNLSRFRFMDWLVTNYQTTGFAFTAALSTGATTATLASSPGGSSANWARGNLVIPCILGQEQTTGTDTGQLAYVRFTYGSPTVQFVTSSSTWTSYTASGLTQNVTCTGGGNNQLFVPTYWNWSQRTQLSSCSWALTSGVPYEVCFALCNQQSADCWITIPVQFNTFMGTQGFWTSLANLALANLNATCRLIPEFTNEYWNLRQTLCPCTVIGYALFPSIGNNTEESAQWYGSQVALIADAFYAAYGASAYGQQITMSMGYGSGPNSGGAFQTAESMNASAWVAQGNYAPYQHPYAKYQATGVGIDAIHVAPYWTNPSSTVYNQILTYSTQAEQLNALFSLAYTNVDVYGYNYGSNLSTSGFVGSANVALTAAIADNSSQAWANLPYLGYEGGNNFSGTGTWETLFIAAHRDQRFGYLYYDPTNQLSSNPGFLVSVLSAGLKSFDFFEDCGFYGADFAWYALESTMQMTALAPTYGAGSYTPPIWAACQEYLGNYGSSTFNYYISPTGNDAAAGTLAAPWAVTSLVTSSSNFSKMTGMRVGFLPGTYNVSSMIPSGNPYAGAIQINGGSSTSPTYYGSSNASGVYAIGTATISGFNGSNVPNGGLSYPNNGPLLAGCMNGNSPQLSNQTGWLTIDGLRFTGYSYKAVRIGGVSSASGPSVTGQVIIKNCEFTGQTLVGLSNSSDNESSIWVDGISTSNSALITNNWFHDNQGTGGTSGDQHLNSIFIFNSANVTISYNTGYNSGGLAWGKDSANQGTTVAYNYVDMSMMTASGGMNCFNDFTGAYNNTTGLTLTSNFHHNICVADNAFNFTLKGAAVGETWQTPVNIYNNTIIANGSSSTGTWAVGRSAGLVSIYNNIYAGTAGGASYGVQCTGTSSLAINDYNGYITAVNWGVGASQSANGGYPSGTTSSLSTYQADVVAGGGPAGVNSHSVPNNSPAFVASGTLAPYYQLQATSPFKNVGSTTGTVGGTVCDMGAWGGAIPPTSIGCNFASAT
jgi:hypothetical protein